MDQELWYHSPSANRDFGLQEAPHLHAASGLRGHEWSYTLGAHSLGHASRRARETQLDAYPADPAAFDDFMLAADADMANHTPGVIYARTGDGVWQQRAFMVTKAEQEVHFLESNADIRLTAVLLDGVWLKYGKVMSFSPRLSAGDGMDMGFDLAAPAGSVVKATSLKVAGLPSGEFGDQRTFQLLPLFTPVDATGQQVSWAVDDAGVASVSATGLLTLTGTAGSFNLSCRQSGGVSDSHTITVSFDAQGEGTAREGLTFGQNLTTGADSGPTTDDPTVLDIHITSAGTNRLYSGTPLNLTTGHTYRLSYEYRLASGTAPTTGTVANLAVWQDQHYWEGKEVDVSALSTTWAEDGFVFADLPSDGKMMLLVNSDAATALDAHIQIRRLSLTDITAGGGQVTDTAMRYGLFSWRDLGFDTDSDVLTASFSALSASGSRKPLHLIAGHEYRLSVEERSDTAQGDGYLWPAVDNLWDYSIGIWVPYNHDWQSYSKTFVASKTGDFAFYLNVEKPGTGTYSLRNLRLDDLTLGTTGGGQINEPSLASLESLGYTLTDGMLTLASTDDKDAAAESPRTVNLVGGHTYRMRYEKTGSNMSAHINEQWADGFGATLTSTWVACQKDITIQSTGVIPSTVTFFINGHSSIKVRNLYLQDVHYCSGGGQVNDGILRLHTPATGVSSSGHTDFWRENDANVLPMPAGHTYRLSIRMRLSARDPKTSQTVYAGVGHNLIGWRRALCLLTHEWQTFTEVFSTTQEAPASSVRAYIHLADNQPETWLEANDMTLIDTTSAARQIMHADWRTTDGSEHVINGASIFKQ